MNKKSSRRRFFVDPRLQLALVLRVALYWVVCTVVLALLASVQVLLTGGNLGYGVLIDRVLVSFGPALVASVIVLPMLLFDCVRFSNRFAGPMFRLRDQLKQLADTGHAEPVKFRKGDFWYEMAQEFNRVAERMQGRACRRPVAGPRRTRRSHARLTQSLPLAQSL